MDTKIDEDAIPYNKSFEEFEFEHLNKPGTLVWVRSHIVCLSGLHTPPSRQENQMSKKVGLLSVGNYIITCDYVDLVAIPVVFILSVAIAALVLWCR